MLSAPKKSPTPLPAAGAADNAASSSSSSSSSPASSGSSSSSPPSSASKDDPLSTSSHVLLPPSYKEFLRAPWDPDGTDDEKYTKSPTPDCVNSPAPGICVAPDPEDVTRCHALVMGPDDTPYEGGFFYFVMKCPYNYPFAPPRVKLCTTGRGTVRFNPNLYNNGKVCLSILGTWAGPGWQPVLSLSAVLLSVQSLMNAEPYRNEPGFEVERSPGDVQRYSNCIVHETLRCAVIDMVENNLTPPLPESLLDLVRASFVGSLELYEDIVERMKHLDGRDMIDPHTSRSRGVFHFAQLLDRIRKLHGDLLEEYGGGGEEDDEFDGENVDDDDE